MWLLSLWKGRLRGEGWTRPRRARYGVGAIVRGSSAASLPRRFFSPPLCSCLWAAAFVLWLPPIMTSLSFPQLKRPRSWKKRSQRQVSQSTPVSAPGPASGFNFVSRCLALRVTVPVRFRANAKKLAAAEKTKKNKKRIVKICLVINSLIL